MSREVRETAVSWPRPGDVLNPGTWVLCSENQQRRGRTESLDYIAEFSAEFINDTKADREVIAGDEAARYEVEYMPVLRFDGETERDI